MIGGVVSGGDPHAIQLGFSVGTLAGGMVDAAHQKPQQVGKLSDLQLTTSQYGSPIVWVWGNWRLGGQIIWWSDFRETSRKKGSKLTGQRQQVFSYSVDLLIMLCRGPITAIKKIYGEDLVLWDSTGGGSNESQLISIGTNTSGLFKVTFRGYQTGTIAFNSTAGLIQSTLEALTSIGPGNIAVTGSAGGPWTATFQNALAGQNVPRMDMDEFTLAGGSGEGITTLLQGGTPYDITFRYGTADQSIITDMDDQQFAKSGEHVSAYRGRACVYINDLDLTPWGNRIPNFSFLVENATAYEDLVRADGPVVYYRFEDAPGLLVDTGNNHLDLTALTGGGFGVFTQVSGIANTPGGEALATTGASKSQAERTGTVINALLNDQLTVEMWYKFDGTVGSNGASEVIYYTRGNAAWRLSVQPNVITAFDIIQWTLLDVTTASQVTVHNISHARDTNWHHLVVSCDCVNATSKLYLDSVLTDTQTPTATIGGILLTQGTQNVSVADSYYLDEFAVYDKALTAAQIAEHFNGRSVQVRDVLADIFTECGLSGDQYDVRDATDVVSGYAITDRSEARGAVEGLLAAYFTDLSEYDGRLVAIRRGGASVVTVDALDLGAELVEPGSDLEPRPVIVTRRLQELELPFGVDFAFISANNGYQQSSQRAIRYTKQHLQEQITLSAPLVFTEDAARLIAEKLLYQAWVERETFEISLPLAYLHLTPADVLTLPVASSLLRCRIVEETLGLPGAITFRLVLDDAAVLTQVVPGGAVNGPVSFVTPITNTSMIAWNGNAGRDADADSIGLYVAANGATAGVWEGAILYLSRDAGATYQELTTLADPGTFGTTSTVLAAGTSTGVFDNTNTVDITLTGGTDNPPVSRSDADLFAGLNGAVIGDEYIQFGTVTSLGGNSYRLAHLVRGRRGTDAFWDEHRTGERVAFDDGGITRVSLPDDLVTGTILTKAVASGQTLADVSPVTVRVYGRETLEYAPVGLAGVRSGGNDLTATFVRRSRRDGDADWADFASLPLDTLTERYTIFVLGSAGTTITAITQAEQTVVTAAGHGLTVGDLATFLGLGGMLPLNGQTGTVVAVSGTSFTVDINTSAYPAWTSAGTVRKPVRTISAVTSSFGYTSAQATADGNPPAGPVTFIIHQLGDDSRRGASLIGAL